MLAWLALGVARMLKALAALLEIGKFRAISRNLVLILTARIARDTNPDRQIYTCLRLVARSEEASPSAQRLFVLWKAAVMRN